MNFLLSEIGIGNAIFESHICLETVVRTYLYIKNRGLSFHCIACTLTQSSVQRYVDVGMTTSHLG